MDSNPADINRWIKEHAADDVNRLRLRYHGDPAMMHAITQIECRRRCRSKIPELLACDDFRFPDTLAAEQCTSSLLAGWHASRVAPGSRVLDLTCGLGVDTFAMARQAREVLTVEIDHAKADCARHNAAALGLADVVRVEQADAQLVISGLRQEGERYDAIFIDPARRSADGRRLYSLTDCSPDVLTLLPDMRAVASHIIIKASPMLDLTMMRRQLPEAALTVLGTPTDCLEVVAEIGPSIVPGCSAVTLDPIVHPAEPPEWATGREYLYEPWPAVMKLADFSAVARRYGMEPLSADSHIFCSTTYHPYFEGNIYVIENQYEFGRRGLREIAAQHTELHVSARGLGITTAELTRRLGLRASACGTHKLFGVTIASPAGPSARATRALLLCRPLSATLAP